MFNICIIHSIFGVLYMRFGFPWYLRVFERRQVKIYRPIIACACRMLRIPYYVLRATCAHFSVRFSIPIQSVELIMRPISHFTAPTGAQRLRSPTPRHLATNVNFADHLYLERRRTCAIRIASHNSFSRSQYAAYALFLSFFLYFSSR